MRAAAGLALLLSGCHLLQPTLCEPCAEGGCDPGLACVQAVCLPVACEGADCSPDYAACGLAPDCGEGPACGPGLKCLAGGCAPPEQVTLGWAHACVRWGSGRITCWGGNRPGVAGDPSAWTASPTDIAGISQPEDVVTGVASTCALQADGQVLCWGENEHGQLGRFTSEDLTRRFQDGPTPAPVSDVVQADLVGMGQRVACAVEGADLRCWGQGHACLLGDASAEPSAVPVPVTPGARFTQLTGGERHVVGVADGRALGWGDDAEGQLAGRPGCGPRDLGFADVVQVAAGAAHTCVLDGAGLVACVGRLGEGPVELPEPAVEVRAAFDTTCARLASGSIACWGRADDGVPLTLEPTLIPGTAGALTFDIGGGGAGCFTRADGVFCWGTRAFGVVDGERATASPQRRLPGIAAQVGMTHACALDADGAITCWGDNRYGQVGQPVSRFEGPTRLPDHRADALALTTWQTCWLDAGAVWCTTPDGPARVGGLPPVEALAAGWGHACALDRLGQVWCWGDNGLGQADPSSRELVPAPRVVEGAGPAVQLVAGGTATCARAADGDVRCWGEGHPGGPQRRYQNAASVAVAVQHTCAVIDGQVWCHGANQYGQLGDGTARTPAAPVRVPLDDVVQVATDFFHSCALTADGAAWCWGQDLNEGRLGVGPTHDHVRPVRVPLPARLRALDVGARATCAVDTEDHVWCWGWDGQGVVTATPPFAAEPRRAPLP